MQGAQVLIPMEADLFWQQMRSMIEDVLDQRNSKNGQNGDPSAAQLLKVKEVCELFQISRPTIYDWMRKGQLKSLKIESRRFFLSSDVKDLIEKNRCY